MGSRTSVFQIHAINTALMNSPVLVVENGIFGHWSLLTRKKLIAHSSL